MIKIAVCDDNKVYVELIGKTVLQEFRSHNIKCSVKQYISGDEFLSRHKTECFDAAKEIVRISVKTLWQARFRTI